MGFLAFQPASVANTRIRRYDADVDPLPFKFQTIVSSPSADNASRKTSTPRTIRRRRLGSES
jgi:hypothetical protein